MLTLPILLKALALWGAILIIAIFNGALREKRLVPWLGVLAASAVSGLLLSVAIFLVALMTVSWYGTLTPEQYWLIGSCWLVLTLIFEFSFGRFVQKKDWRELFQAYTFRGGNLWPFVLVVTLASPPLAAWLRGLI
jgi:hypothetical protein